MRSPDTGEVTNVIGSLYNISKRKTRELQDLRARAAERAAALSMEREMALLSKTASVGLSRSDLEVSAR